MPNETTLKDTTRGYRSGYVQLIDTNALRRLGGRGLVVIVERGMGKFVRVGAVLARIDPPDAATPDVAAAVRDAFDPGPVRTFQEDVGWVPADR